MKHRNDKRLEIRNTVVNEMKGHAVGKYRSSKHHEAKKPCEL
jgi:hypothetical protein